jgi:hypothetical protein
MVTSASDNITLGKTLLYSKHTEDGAPYIERVALVLTLEAQRLLTGCKPVSSYIITAKFTTKKNTNLLPLVQNTVIQYFTSTNDTEEEKKDDLYQQL